MQNVLIFLSLGLVSGYLLMRLNAARRLRAAGVRNVGVAETVRLIEEQKAVVVDVREKGEYRAGRIPNSRHIPLGQISRRVKDLEKVKGRPIIVSCRSGRRSAVASIVLSKHGFSNVYNLKGGVTAWSRAKMSLEK